MSKASKLARMKNTVLETTGLTYNPSGGTVELNFTPDVTAPGVSVPLVLAGNTDPGLCGATTTPPLLGYPYAHIRDVKPGTTAGGTFTYYAIAGSSSVQIGSMYWRSRDFNERVVDEIGVSITAGSGVSGGPGNLLNFPTGTYYINGRTPQYAVNRTSIAFYNVTLGQGSESGIVLSGNHTFVGVAAHNDNTIRGRFVVSDSNDSYALITITSNTRTTNGFGQEAWTGPYQPQNESIFTDLEIWKIG